MANTIKNFLIGVGLDTKDFEKGEKEVSTGLGRFRTLAGFAGAAMVGAMGAAGAAAVSAGNRVDKLALSTEKFNTSVGFVYDYGSALKTLGGEATEAEQAVSAAEKALAQFAVKGNFGPLEDAVFAGADSFALSQAQSGEEFLRMLADMVPQMDKQQRMILQDSLSLSDAAMRSLQNGGKAFDQLIERAGSLTGDITGLVDVSREYNRQLAETKLGIEGVSNALAAEMLPALTGILGSVNDFLSGNKDGIAGYASEMIGMQTPARMLYNYAKGDEEAFSSWRPMGERISNKWDSTVGDFSPIDSSMEWLGNRRQDAIEKRTEYRESIQNTEYPEIMSGSVDSQEAIQATPEYSIINNNSSERMTMPPQQINNNLDVKLQMDGREIDTRVVDVIERRERATVEDMQSTTVR